MCVCVCGEGEGIGVCGCVRARMSGSTVTRCSPHVPFTDALFHSLTVGKERIHRDEFVYLIAEKSVN